MSTTRMIRIPSTQTAPRFRCEEAGTAIVELALITPLLVLLVLGASDFGRIFYRAMAVTGAAHAGALYGAQSVAKTADTAGMTTAADQASPGLGITVVSAGQVCRCATGAGTVACTTNTSGCLPLRIYASVTTRATFATIVNYPGIPNSVTITRTAEIRGQ